MARIPMDPGSAQFVRNQRFAVPGPYATTLAPQDEAAFLDWVAKNHVPFDPKDPASDYDMRGYWADIGRKANGTSINPNDGLPHYPDTYKTPFHQSFSAESRYAKKGAPVWINDHQLADPATGRIVFDEKP